MATRASRAGRPGRARMLAANGSGPEVRLSASPRPRVPVSGGASTLRPLSIYSHVPRAVAGPRSGMRQRLSHQTCPTQELLDGGMEVPVAGGRGRGAGDQDQVKTWLEHGAGQAHDLPQAPPHTVPRHRLSHATGNREADARARARAGSGVEYQVWVAPGASFTPDPLDLGRSPKAIPVIAQPTVASGRWRVRRRITPHCSLPNAH